jgi:hypothetical protein
LLTRIDFFLYPTKFFGFWRIRNMEGYNHQKEGNMEIYLYFFLTNCSVIKFSV